MVVVIMKFLALFILNSLKSLMFRCCFFLWKRFILSYNGCRMTVFILIATFSRLLSIGWRSSCSF